MKKFIPLFMVMVLVLGGCTFGKKSKPKSAASLSSSKFKNYVNGYESFSVDFPKDWEVEENPPNESSGIASNFRMLFSAKLPLSDERDLFEERIGIMVVELDLFKKLMATKLKREGTYYQREAQSKIKEAGFTVVDGVNARWTVSKAYWSSKYNSMLRQLGYDIRKNNKIYKVGFVADAGKFYELKPLVDKVVQSIKIY